MSVCLKQRRTEFLSWTIICLRPHKATGLCTVCEFQKEYFWQQSDLNAWKRAVQSLHWQSALAVSLSDCKDCPPLLCGQWLSTRQLLCAMKGWNSISLIFQLFENQYYWLSIFFKLKTSKDNVMKCVRSETFTNPDNSFDLSYLKTLRIFHQESWLEIILDKILSLFTQLCVGRLMMIGWENRVTATVCTRKQ